MAPSMEKLWSFLYFCMLFNCLTLFVFSRRARAVLDLLMKPTFLEGSECVSLTLWLIKGSIKHYHLHSAVFIGVGLQMEHLPIPVNSVKSSCLIGPIKHRAGDVKET